MDTKVANALLGAVTAAALASELASRDSSISGLQVQGGRQTAFALSAGTLPRRWPSCSHSGRTGHATGGRMPCWVLPLRPQRSLLAGPAPGGPGLQGRRAAGLIPRTPRSPPARPSLSLFALAWAGFTTWELLAKAALFATCTSRSSLCLNGDGHADHGRLLLHGTPL